MIYYNFQLKLLKKYINKEDLFLESQTNNIQFFINKLGKKYSWKA